MSSTMINPRKLLEMARKGPKVAGLGRRRTLFLKNDGAANSSGWTTSLADKGHFVVYSIDGMRFTVPLPCLDSLIFVELFKMSEDEFGLPRCGPIILPCTAVFLEYAVSLIQRSVCKDVEKALLASIATVRCSRSCSQHEGLAKQQIVVHGF